MWGADTVEVPHGDATFAPSTELITSVTQLSWRRRRRGVRLVRGQHQGRARADRRSSTCCATASTARSPRPPSSARTAARCRPAASSSRTTRTPSPRSTPPARRRAASPSSAAPGRSRRPRAFPRRRRSASSSTARNPAINDSVFSLRRIFGSDAVFVSVVTGANSIQNAADDPLLGIDVLYNTGQGYPAARMRRRERGSTRSSLAAVVHRHDPEQQQPVVPDRCRPGAGGRLVHPGQRHSWWRHRRLDQRRRRRKRADQRVACERLPLPAVECHLLQRLPDRRDRRRPVPRRHGQAANPRGPSAGVCRRACGSTDVRRSPWPPTTPRCSSTARPRRQPLHGPRDQPVLPQPTTSGSGAGSSSPALWGNLTDEALLDQTITADTLTDKVWGNADFPITATSTSGRSVSLAASGECTLDSPYSPAMIHITAAGSCTITASHPGDGNFNPAEDVVQTITIAQADASATYTGDPMASLAGSDDQRDDPAPGDGDRHGPGGRPARLRVSATSAPRR